MNLHFNLLFPPYACVAFLIFELAAPFIISDLSVASPRFRSHVRSKQEVIMGDELRLGCQAIGKPTPYVHWYKNNQFITPTVDALNVSPSMILGQAGDDHRLLHQRPRHRESERVKVSRFFLKINKIEPGDEGQYSCKVWNKAGQIWRNFTVHIVDLPQRPHFGSDGHSYDNNLILNDRKEVEKWLGEPLDAPNPDSDDDSNDDDDDVEDTKNFPPSKKMFPKSNDLNNLPMMDGSLNAFNSRMNQSSVMSGVNQAAPYWTKPENELLQTVATPAGRQVKLTCRANGKPEPMIIWFKNNVEIKLETGRSVGMSFQIKKWALILEDVVPSDKGVYTCVAINKYGNISHNYTLEVVERLPVRPIISPEYPKNTTVFLGDNATFECPVLSDLQPHIVWFKHCAVNGSYQIACGNYISSDFREPQDGYDDIYDLPDPMVLSINNVNETDEGWYSCVAGNNIGMSSGSAYLAVIARNDTVTYKLETSDVQHNALILLVTILLAVLIVILFLYLRYSRNYKIKRAVAMLEEGQFNDSSAFVKKVIKVYRSESNASDQAALLPKITITPRYQSGKFNQEFNLHYDYEMPLDPEWEICRDDVSLIKSCGEGAFGQVYVSELRLKKHGGESSDAAEDASDLLTASEDGDRYDHVTVAVKMLKDNATERELIDLISEMEVMKQICKPPKHPNIINMIGCCTQIGPLYVIVEYCALGNLLNFLRALRPQPQADSNYEEPNSKRLSKKVLTTQDLVQYSLQIARGMKYLSDKKCIHRDLAARNVLVSEDYVLKIGDFGLARDITEDDYYRKTSEGRLPIKWMAPECLCDRRYTVKSDVWSYGVLLWEIMTLGGKPYPSVPFESLYQILKQGHRMNQPHNCPKEVYSLMLTCWQDNPDDRWSFAQIEKYLDDLITSNSEEYVEVIPDNLAPIDDDDDKDVVDTHMDNEKSHADELSEQADSAKECSPHSDVVSTNQCGVAKASQRTPIKMAAPTLLNQTLLTPLQLNYSNQLSTPNARTALRPISETSECFDMGTDEEDTGSVRSTYRKDRPSATDSGNPSSPGCSLFDGSSDSVDSKCSSTGCTSSASSGAVFHRDARTKRHSDPIPSVVRGRNAAAAHHRASIAGESNEATGGDDGQAIRASSLSNASSLSINGFFSQPSIGNILLNRGAATSLPTEASPSNADSLSNNPMLDSDADHLSTHCVAIKTCDWPLPTNRIATRNEAPCADWPKPELLGSSKIALHSPACFADFHESPPVNEAYSPDGDGTLDIEESSDVKAASGTAVLKYSELNYSDLFLISRESVV